MNANRKALIFASGLALLGVAAAYVALRSQHPQEPTFEGRPLISWLPDLDFSAAPASRSNAMHAIQQMGTSAVPVLVSVVIAKTDSFKYELGTLAKRFFPGRLDLAEKWGDAAYRQRLGVEGLRALGPAATTAIPALASQLTNQPYPGMAAEGLAAIGAPAVPYLIAALSCTNDQQKLTAVGAFQKLGPVARDAMPYLKRLYDRDKAVWYASGAITNAMYRIDAAVAQQMLAEP